jgi:hypothetical protein
MRKLSNAIIATNFDIKILGLFIGFLLVAKGYI